eukprot:CAMPEP_0196727726 /NCGR_PEP_ID=MMETSP1091-20130531/8639_1 /TAXON_ID=302021 /ORGANISM="Rhodomonas sp., Strain CCMP768" /LENGTH=126 /DNA_ID=CAMNT_0042070379 /DNA_START=157 /DNA_END=538 /DNA_ORIENTATION=-
MACEKPCFASGRRRYAAGSQLKDLQMSEAAGHAVREVTEVEADDYFVFLLSDANLRRYGIEPEELGDLLVADKRVNAFAIFIAGGSEAGRLAKALPFGRGYVCADTARLPGAFKEMFSSVSVQKTS